MPPGERSPGAPFADHGMDCMGRCGGGLPADRYGSHSLRVGGATALYHAGMPVEIIKRYGRWVSDCFQGYLWEGNEDSKGLAAKMASDTSGLMATKGR